MHLWKKHNQQLFILPAPFEIHIGHKEKRKNTNKNVAVPY